jgi:hypothetical protein
LIHPNLILPSSNDYRCEPLVAGLFSYFSLVLYGNRLIFFHVILCPEISGFVQGLLQKFFGVFFMFYFVFFNKGNHSVVTEVVEYLEFSII